MRAAAFLRAASAAIPEPSSSRVPGSGTGCGDFERRDVVVIVLVGLVYEGNVLDAEEVARALQADEAEERELPGALERVGEASGAAVIGERAIGAPPENAASSNR